MISYGLSSLEEESTLKQVYGTDSRAVFERLGFGAQGRVNKVRVFPIRWFYEDAAPAAGRERTGR